MGTAIKYKKEIMNLTKELTENKLEELIDFAKFLKAKSEESPFFRMKTVLHLSEICE